MAAAAMGAAPASSQPARCCPICGADMTERRPQAKVCGGSCRAERSRLERLLRGEPCDGLETVADWLAHRRLRRPLGAPGAPV